jgi:hypothetical protein
MIAGTTALSEDERAAVIAVIRAEIAAEGSRTAFRRCIESALAKLELEPAASPARPVDGGRRRHC